MLKISNYFLGLSTDIKPIVGIRSGVEFIEQDTGKTYIWDGTTWLPHWAKIGVIGSMGPIGPIGPTGVIGSIGPTGVTGPTGPTGV